MVDLARVQQAVNGLDLNAVFGASNRFNCVRS